MQIKVPEISALCFLPCFHLVDHCEYASGAMRAFPVGTVFEKLLVVEVDQQDG